MSGRSILIYSLLTAILVVAIRFFEISFFTGQVSLKLYVAGIGILFLAIGLLVGLRARRKRSEPEVVVRYVEREIAETAAETAAPEPVVAATGLLSARARRRCWRCWPPG